MRITLDIVSDAVCPWCFIGKRRLERALPTLPDDVEFDITWRPYQLNPDMPKGGMDRSAYLAAKFGGEERAAARYETVRNAGAGEGIAFNFEAMTRMPNTIDAHRLIGLAGRAGLQERVVEALFSAYFLEGRDIGDLAVLTDIGTAAGFDAKTLATYLASEDDVERVRREDAMARQMGIQGVPCFIFQRKYAVSGAQEPAVFGEVVALLKKEVAESAEQPAAS
jgi:predicted DsbA family dithiol-disulfide isomerase